MEQPITLEPTIEEILKENLPELLAGLPLNWGKLEEQKRKLFGSLNVGCTKV